MTKGHACAATAASLTSPAESGGAWRGDGLYARSSRFGLTLLAPIGVGILGQGSQWLAYAILTCLLGFTADTGGPPFRRLPGFLIAGLVVLVGGMLGTAVRGDVVLTALAPGLIAVLYGLVEGSHASYASSARIMCLSTVIAAFFTPVEPFDTAVIAGFAFYSWLISIAWDAATGLWRPFTGPSLWALASDLRASALPRWSFAAVCGASVVAASVLAQKLGLRHPDWAIFALLLTLHVNASVGRKVVQNLILGTVLGVAFASAYAALLPSIPALSVGATLAALLRFPAQQRHGALGIGAVSAFVILLLQLVGDLTGAPSRAPVDRLIDIALGCGLSIAALWINGKVQQRLNRGTGAV
jgi:fusaric acid resistance family protein